jgi:hypothetical protein
MHPLEAKLSHDAPIDWTTAKALVRSNLLENCVLHYRPDERYETLVGPYIRRIDEALLLANPAEMRLPLPNPYCPWNSDALLAFRALVECVRPQDFWPDVIMQGHPEQWYWHAICRKANKRSGLPEGLFPGIFLRITEADFLRVVTPDDKKIIAELLRHGRALVAAMQAQYGKAIDKLPSAEIDKFESMHENTPIAELTKLARRKEARS